MSMLASPEPSAVTPIDEAAVFRKATLRLIPFLFLLYVVNLIDRNNIGIAKLQMVDDERYAILDKAAFAFGAGVFYVGYLLFEVPANLILMRVGARAWIARILVSWGLVSAAMMFVQGPWSFAALRALLGVAEAGFFPGIIYYLNEWFPSRIRARAVAQFMLGGAVASFIGNPLSGWILDSMDQVGGLHGWQWIFLLEGIPAIALGFVTLWVLTDKPEHAKWLRPEERTWLTNLIRVDRVTRAAGGKHSLADAFLDPRVWLLIAVYFTVAMGDNSFAFYIPSFLKSQFPDWSASRLGLLAAAPSAAAMACMVLVGRHSDRTGERRWHVACSALLAAFGWALASLAASGNLNDYVDGRWVFVAAAVVTLVGMKSMLPTFWTLPPMFLSGPAAAGGIALINSVANLGGMFGPNAVGWIESTTGSYTYGYLVLAAALLCGGLLVLRIKPPDQSREHAITAS
ncbi:MAG: MFS transporter [Gemmataceae bacterium]|nr:MFS transporter [Gemmataceae bacterium]